MGIVSKCERICQIEIRRFLLMILLAAGGVVFFQIYVLPFSKNLSQLSSETGSIALVESNFTFLYQLRNKPPRLENTTADYADVSGSEDEDDHGEAATEENANYATSLDADGDLDDSESTDQRPANELLYRKREGLEKSLNVDHDVIKYNSSAQVDAVQTGQEHQTRSSYTMYNRSAEAKFPVLVAPNTNFSETRIPYFKHRRREQVISLSKIDQLLVQSRAASRSPRPRRSSPRDRELLSAKFEILNAPVLRDTPRDYSSVFRNISMFKRSFELMERMLKVYVYKEGEKPIFHSPPMRGIYASEGWFMKLMEGNRNFTVRDPRKAHLFYLPFSVKSLRRALGGKAFQSPKDLERYLKRYVDLISRKYKFWNRTSGADHFLVACHDWGNKLTRRCMNNCIRSLCNSNAAQRFSIGKDTTLPVTYVRSATEPGEFVGGKPPSERKFLAFFAGSMHGYLRPVLLEYWENRHPDMKIFGPMPRDPEGKRHYREYMKSSRYCICARGYEVHTPRVVEAILHECVPVILSDNYVPPFFEVLNWEAFSVFLEEKDVPNLRNILASIPDERYLAMHARVKMVQPHFLWHKKPEKYDLFHMVLHSVWYNRVFQVKPR